MKGSFLVRSHAAPRESNIYADRSALVLDWLLRVGIDKKWFSLREAAKDIGASIGLVQRVFGVLVLKGFLRTEGMRTGKKFSLRKPSLLLKSWIENYSLVKKCKMWTYHSSFQGKAELLDALKKSNLCPKVAQALHSAAEAYGCKNTNLDTLELYILDPSRRGALERVLRLEPQERGYEVLLIDPYYKSLLNQEIDSSKNMRKSSPLLTFLDLYHFPLRGQEQAQFMAEHILALKRILGNGGKNGI